MARPGCDAAEGPGARPTATTRRRGIGGRARTRECGLGAAATDRGRQPRKTPVLASRRPGTVGGQADSPGRPIRSRRPTRLVAGRSSGSRFQRTRRADARPAATSRRAFPSRAHLARVASCGGRHRLQRRVRGRFSRPSLRPGRTRNTCNAANHSGPDAAESRRKDADRGFPHTPLRPRAPTRGPCPGRHEPPVMTQRADHPRGRPGHDANPDGCPASCGLSGVDSDVAGRPCRRCG